MRSHGLPGPSDPGDLVRPAVILQIETAAGLAAVDAIASVPGVDALLVGPNDLALSLGLPVDASARTADEAARHAAACDRVRDACAERGIAAGMYCTGGEPARAFLDRGFRFVSAATDSGVLETNVRREIREAQPPRR